MFTPFAVIATAIAFDRTRYRASMFTILFKNCVDCWYHSYIYMQPVLYLRWYIRFPFPSNKDMLYSPLCGLYSIWFGAQNGCEPKSLSQNQSVDPGSIQGSHRPISFTISGGRTRANGLSCTQFVKPCYQLFNVLNCIIVSKSNPQTNTKPGIINEILRSIEPARPMYHAACKTDYQPYPIGRTHIWYICNTIQNKISRIVICCDR